MLDFFSLRDTPESPYRVPCSSPYRVLQLHVAHTSAREAFKSLVSRSRFRTDTASTTDISDPTTNGTYWSGSVVNSADIAITTVFVDVNEDVKTAFDIPVDLREVSGIAPAYERSVCG